MQVFCVCLDIQENATNVGRKKERQTEETVSESLPDRHLQRLQPAYHQADQVQCTHPRARTSRCHRLHHHRSDHPHRLYPLAGIHTGLSFRKAQAATDPERPRHRFAGTENQSVRPLFPRYAGHAEWRKFPRYRCPQGLHCQAQSQRFEAVKSGQPLQG